MILARFMLMSGLTAEQSADWLPLCKQAAAQLINRLKPNVDAAAHSEELCMAGAALVFYQYSMIQDVLQGYGFSAGEVKVTRKSDSAAAAKKLWNEMQASVAELLTDGDFVFERVQP